MTTTVDMAMTMSGLLVGISRARSQGDGSDRMVYIWDEVSTEELFLLSGHTGCINAVFFSPEENTIASGSSDKAIYVGELGE